MPIRKVGIFVVNKEIIQILILLQIVKNAKRGIVFEPITN